MSKILNIIVIMSLLLSLSSITPLAREKKPRKSNETETEIKGVEVQNEEQIDRIVSQIEEETEQDGEFEMELPNYEIFVQGVNNAKDVLESIEKFIKDSDNKLESYQFLNTEDRRSLSEELSDLNTRVSQITADINSVHLDTFEAEMPKITDKLTDLNNNCLKLNVDHEEEIIEKLVEAYVVEHDDFQSDNESIYEEYQDFFNNNDEIHDLSDGVDDLIRSISTESDENDWNALETKEEELLQLINLEADRHNPE